jgi:DNA integrity scanning protein DisA with diadenylate cyclase activity
MNWLKQNALYLVLVGLVSLTVVYFLSVSFRSKIIEMGIVEMWRFGHESLSIFFRFTQNLLSVLDPDSTLSFFTSFRNSHESPSFKSPHLAQTQRTQKYSLLGPAYCGDVEI